MRYNNKEEYIADLRKNFDSDEMAIKALEVSIEEVATLYSSTLNGQEMIRTAIDERLTFLKDVKKTLEG